MERAGIELITGKLAKVTLQSTLLEKIREGQNADKKLSDLKQEMQNGNAKDFTMLDTGLFRFKGRICVPDSDELRKEILAEAHTTPYSVHPGTTKMYHDLKFAELYMNEIVRLHGTPYSIVCNQDARFTSSFWETTNLPSGWHRMKCCMEESVGLHFTGMNWERENYLEQHTNEAIQKIRARMVTAQSRQKSYADLKRKHVEFEVGDHVFLRVTPRKGISVKRFGKKGKLSPRYVGPFEILDRVGNVAYRVALPPSLSGVHNVFHVSQLRKYISDPSHVLSYETLGLQEDLSFDEHPVKILDRKDKVLGNRTISLVKVLWTF
ncbi:uncharacterized protein LOC133806088 [Humulus lupulus]|uniref:uncharacterized protein LOC133806088 n=1 Tax=Humulus lupulus TaxID=3486 RepID=UPI002B408E61|nr:uncharacterized protein LOC133806088 [Humulus lupulus]